VLLLELLLLVTDAGNGDDVMHKQKGLSSVIAAAVGSLALATLSPAQDTSKASAAQAGEMKAIRAAIANPRPATVNAVVLQFSGTFDDLPKRFEEFTKVFEAQGLGKRKLPSNPTAIYVAYEDPEGKSTYKLGVGVQMPGKVEVKDPLRVETFENQKAVRVSHVGSYKELGNVRNLVDKESQGRGAAKAIAGSRSRFPIIARLLNDPRKVPDRQRRTELIIPF
jgi:hypothetical protein